MHIVIYVPGLGDGHVGGRRLIVAGWRIYGIRPVVHQINWADKEPYDIKFQRLLLHIDEQVQSGHKVSLVGESAGASMVMNAFAVRQDAIHRVACICGKLARAENIQPNTFLQNPAFAESMRMLPGSLAGISQDNLARVRSVHPLRDPIVPVSDTIIPGAESKLIPTIGHATSIVLGDTIFSHILVGFLKRD